jgi:hypothetical protein
MIYDYIIIGGGISGLTIYKLLIENNPRLNILLLEANNRIGGRIYEDENGFELGAKFIHGYANNITSAYNIKINKPKINKPNYNNIDIINLKSKQKKKYLNWKKHIYYTKKTIKYKLKKNANENTLRSVIADSVGTSMIKNVHLNAIEYYDDYKFNFTKIINKFKDKDGNIKHKYNILLNNKFIKYTKLDNYYEIISKSKTVKKYKCSKIIFALPVSILSRLDIPFKNDFNKWNQNNIIINAIKLNKKKNNITKKIIYIPKIKNVSLYYDNKKNIIYINIYDSKKTNLEYINNISKKILDILNIYRDDIITNKIFNWKDNKYSLGGWTITKKTLNLKIINKIKNGYNNEIFYVGDYLTNIFHKCGEVSSAIKSCLELVKKLN